MDTRIDIKRLAPSDLGLIGDIDRSEHVGLAYVVIDGRLATNLVDWHVPTFDPEGAGDHSVQEQVEHWRPLVESGAVILGAYSEDQLMGLAIVDLAFEPGLAWLAFLHVSRRYRRMGVASALWADVVRKATTAGIESMYVSAIPSESAVGFYLSRGCSLSQPPNEKLFEAEPDDIHLICPLSG